VLTVDFILKAIVFGEDSELLSMVVQGWVHPLVKARADASADPSTVTSCRAFEAKAQLVPVTVGFTKVKTPTLEEAVTAMLKGDELAESEKVAVPEGHPTRRVNALVQSDPSEAEAFT